jgi:hypothetical protein
VALRIISTTWVEAEGQSQRVGSQPGWVQTSRAPLLPPERELAKAEKLSLEEGGKDARGLLSGLRRRKRPLSWRGHGDGPQLPDPDPCARVGMHTSGVSHQGRRRSWGAWGGGLG